MKTTKEVAWDTYYNQLTNLQRQIGSKNEGVKSLRDMDIPLPEMSEEVEERLNRFLLVY